jgi:EpsD family peptidyl-prolyl cis-trans isomerase
MNALVSPRPTRVRSCIAAAVLAAFAIGLITGCGEKKKDRQPTSVAARVNEQEVTVQQINQVLQLQRNLRPELADAASHQVLERLIDQELVVQKAQSLDLDKDPRVQQQIEAARREVVARAYAERLGEDVGKPTDEEIAQYYKDKPALFSARRIYSIQELAIEARPDQVATLRAQLTAAKSITEFIDYLKANDYRFAANQAVRAAEQLPAPALDTLSRMADGQASVVQGTAGVQVVVLAGSRSQPVSEERARPAIEQYLINDRKRKRVAEEVKALRAAARIEYVGPFVQSRPDAASAPPADTTAPAAEPPRDAASR